MMTYQFQGRTASMAGSDRRCTSSIQKSKRRVTFKPTITVQPIKNIAMQSEDKSRLYYSKDELKTLSLEIKAIHTLSKELSSSSQPCGVHSTRKGCIVGLEADPALRGLELYLCSTRVRNKLLARSALLKISGDLKENPLMSYEDRHAALASASSKLTQWSRRIAHETARLDSIRAYGEGSTVIPVNDPVEISPFPVIAKRRRVSCGDRDDAQLTCKRSRTR